MKIKDYYKEKSYIHYSNCHEDIEYVMKYIDNNPKKILSIGSSLDNSLALLTLDPEEVVIIDSNPSQIYLCNLKKIGIKYLSYYEFLILIGITEGNSQYYYEKIKTYLDKETINYFDQHLYLITDIKLINAGRFEYYFSVFKNKVLPLIHRQETIDLFMNASNLEEQNKNYDQKFNNFRFKLMFKVFFSKFIMKRLGRDKDYFKYNKGSLSKLLKKRFELGIRNNLNKNNPYLQYIIYNRFISLPFYLRKENFDIIKKNIDKVVIKNDLFQNVINDHNKYDFMYLSDIFEYLSNDETARLSTKIENNLNDCGIVIFFNMMNKRTLTCGLSEELLDQTNDLAFYYMACYRYKND